MADVYDIQIDQGTTMVMPIEWQAPVSGVMTGVNMTGYSVRMQIRSSTGASAALLTLSTDNGKITYTDITKGKFTVRAEASDTDALTSGVYDLEVVSASNDVTRLLQGRVKVKRQVTR